MWDFNEAVPQGEQKTLVSTNPATGEVIWEGPEAGAFVVDAAVKAARKAQRPWNLLGLKGRLEIMERFRAGVEASRSNLARLIARETGKPLWDANTEVGAVLGKLAITADAYVRRTGKSRQEQDGVLQELRHRPHGVMAVFGPYNFPVHLPNGHIMPSLIAGNTVVFKPSEQTPAVAEFIYKLWREAGLPDGVLNLVHGGKETGIALSSHPDINGILFTGSYATGKAIHQAMAGHPEMLLALEMGGNNPLIVWDAEDARAAAKIAVHSAYISAGQRCTCARRLILPKGREGDAVVEAVKEFASRLKVGAYNESPEPFMGPVINNEQADRLLRAEAHLIAHGAKRLLPLERLMEGKPFLTPGLLEVSDVAERPDEEYFGPLLQVIRVSNYPAALQEANNTAYGLAAGLISDKFALWTQFHEHIRAGIVNWNRPTTGASSAAPFGGVGVSGNHRPAAYYAADYSAYPVATLSRDAVIAPPDAPGMG